MFEKPKVLTPAQMEEIRTKRLLRYDFTRPVKFLSDHYVVGDSYRSVWVIREYPPPLRNRPSCPSLLTAAA